MYSAAFRVKRGAYGRQYFQLTAQHIVLMLLYVSATNFSHLDLHRATFADDDEEEDASVLISAIHWTLNVLRFDS